MSTPASPVGDGRVAFADRALSFHVRTQLLPHCLPEMRRPSSFTGRPTGATPGVRQEPIGRLRLRGSGAKRRDAWRADWRNILCAALTGICRCCCRARPRAASNDEVYTVGNYPVDAQAANAVAAKEQGARRGPAGGLPLALEARRAGDRLRPAEAAHGAQVVATSSRASPSARSATRAPATSRASTSPSAPDFVRAVLQQQGMPFVEEQAREIIVVPVVRDAQGARRHGSDRAPGPRPGRASTSSTRSHRSSLQPLKPDIHADTLKMLIDGTRPPIASSPASTAGPTSSLRSPRSTPPPSGFNVTLAGIDAVGTVLPEAQLSRVRRRYRLRHGACGGRRRRACSRAAGRSLKAGAGHRTAGQSVSLQAEYRSLAEWREIRQQLLAGPRRR